MCAIGPKGKARTFELHATSDPYIHDVIYFGWFQLFFLVRPKRTGTACAIGPEGNTRIHKPCAPSVPKAKLRHMDYMNHHIVGLLQFGFILHTFERGVGPEKS